MTVSKAGRDHCWPLTLCGGLTLQATLCIILIAPPLWPPPTSHASSLIPFIYFLLKLTVSSSRAPPPFYIFNAYILLLLLTLFYLPSSCLLPYLTYSHYSPSLFSSRFLSPCPFYSHLSLRLLSPRLSLIVPSTHFSPRLLSYHPFFSFSSQGFELGWGKGGIQPPPKRFCCCWEMSSGKWMTASQHALD